MIKIVIGIQARLSSSRLKNKAIAYIDTKKSFEYLLDSVKSSCEWLSSRNRDVNIKTFLLVPEQERIDWGLFLNEYNDREDNNVRMHIGSMNNVFSRYESLYNFEKPDHFVRLTADCPFLPAPLLSKMLMLSINHRIDYMTNTFEQFRTMPDGYDVEIMSHKCFEWLKEKVNNFTESDYEHVTTFLKRNYRDAKWMRISLVTTHFDTSDYKYSIDTQKELTDVKERYERKLEKDRAAESEGFKIYFY